MGDECVVWSSVKVICATAWCSGVRGVSRLSIQTWIGDKILADWAIDSVGGSPLKRNADGCLNVQQCLEGLRECYGTFTMPIRHFKLPTYLEEFAGSQP